jgi:hypothetical protein
VLLFILAITDIINNKVLLLFILAITDIINNKVLLLELAQDWTGSKCSNNLGYEMVALLT